MELSPNPKPITVVVALLDALGMRSHTIAEAQRYLQIVPQFSEALQAAQCAEKLTHLKSDPKVRFFGDSILITWEVQDAELLPNMINGIWLATNFMLMKAFEGGVALRGAISYGEILAEGEVCLGPAITDVAAWYDKAQLIGVIGTPRMSDFIKWKNIEDFESLDSIHETTFTASFAAVPLKTGSINTYVGNWFCFASVPDQHEPHHYMRWFLKCSENHSIPASAREKFANTEAFFARVIMDYCRLRESH